MQYVLYHTPYKKIHDTISGSIDWLDMKAAVVSAAKEGIADNQADKFDAELLRPIQLNLERHRYVLESSIGPLMISPNNHVEEGTTRLYLDHFRNKKYTISPFDEKVNSVVDMPPAHDQIHSEVIKSLGEALKESANQSGKKDFNFFSTLCLLSLAQGK